MVDSRQRLVFFGYRLSAASLRRLPRPLALALARRGARLWWRLARRRRDVVAANLARASGLEVGSRQLARLVRDAYDSYGRYWVDATKIDLFDVSYFESHFVVRHEHFVTDALAAGRGVILALPHLGSWEIGGMYGLQRGHPLTAVAEPLEPPELLAWFVAQRESIGLSILPLGAGASAELLRVLRDGGILALVADRDLKGDGVEVEFFGETTRLPGGPALLALRSGAALLPCAIYQRDGGLHEGIVRPPLDTRRSGDLRDDVARVTAVLAGEFEDLIRAAPAQWHVFQPNWPGDKPATRRA